MDGIIELLVSFGYWGMLIVAFIAGSFFPFSSEAVMTGLLAAGLDPWGLIIYGTIGNVAGGMFNYFVGRMGKLEWIEKYLHVKQKDLDRATRFMAGRGAWMGFSPSYRSWAVPSPLSWDSCGLTYPSLSPVLPSANSYATCCSFMGPASFYSVKNTETCRP